jgi:undecaprenyl-diphosphatase
LLGAALLTSFAVAALLVPEGPVPFDQRWSDWMTAIQTSALDRVAFLFNDLGRGLGKALTIGAIGVILLVARRWWALLAFAVTESLTPLASSLVKASVGRTRPPNGVIHPLGSAFPSGHAAYAGATCVALALLFTRPGAHRRSAWALALLGIAVMAWSRTYLQVHWLSDVIAGSILGVGIALLVFAGVQLITPRLENLWGGRATQAPAPPPDGEARRLR